MFKIDSFGVSPIYAIITQKIHNQQQPNFEGFLKLGVVTNCGITSDLNTILVNERINF